MTRRAWGLATWLLVLVTVALSGRCLLRGPLAPPDLADPASWAAWAGSRTPLQAAFAVVGLILVAVAWYLLAVTVLQVAARLAGASRLVAMSDWVTLPVLRRSVHAALGLGLASSVMAAGVARSLPEPGLGGRGVTLVVAMTPPGEEPVQPAAPDAPAEAEPPVMRLLPDAGAVGAEAPEAVTSPPRLVDEAWTVAPGDHLWSVAARVLEGAWGTAATDDEVVPYWRRLVDANADRLADPANPDLLFSGQVLTVVTPPAR